MYKKPLLRPYEPQYGGSTPVILFRFLTFWACAPNTTILPIRRRAPAARAISDRIGSSSRKQISQVCQTAVFEMGGVGVFLPSPRHIKTRRPGILCPVLPTFSAETARGYFGEIKITEPIFLRNLDIRNHIARHITWCVLEFDFGPAWDSARMPSVTTSERTSGRLLRRRVT